MPSPPENGTFRARQGLRMAPERIVGGIQKRNEKAVLRCESFFVLLEEWHRNDACISGGLKGIVPLFQIQVNVFFPEKMH